MPIGKLYSGIIRLEESLFREEVLRLQTAVCDRYSFLRRNAIPPEELNIGSFVFRRGYSDRSTGQLPRKRCTDEAVIFDLNHRGGKSPTLDNVVSLVDDTVAFVYKNFDIHGWEPCEKRGYTGCTDDPFAFRPARLLVTAKGQVVLALTQEYPAMACLVKHVVDSLTEAADAHPLKMVNPRTFCIPLFTKNRESFRFGEEIYKFSIKSVSQLLDMVYYAQRLEIFKGYPPFVTMPACAARLSIRSNYYYAGERVVERNVLPVMLQVINANPTKKTISDRVLFTGSEGSSGGSVLPLLR